jgi:DNA-binding transcriptional MerR regulator/methylmalonyl-CoA mutase cobalamin-binding subunit
MHGGSYPIQIVVQRTGLSAHTIRIWEKRYGAVKPQRTETNRRLYSEAEVERLSLLRQLTERGQNIGYVARLDTLALRGLLSENASSPITTGAGHSSKPAEVESLLHETLEATRRMDAEALHATLERAERTLGNQGVVQKLVAPVAQALGQRWRDGDLSAAHEHFATAALKLYLGQAAKPFGLSATAPLVVVGTPAGQLHELGALLASACAANLGWRVLYLGPSLGAADLAGAALQNEAKAVALSLVYPDDDPHLPAELSRLRKHLPNTPVIVGGRAAPAYQDALQAIDAAVAGDLSELGSLLDQARRRSTE